MKRILLLFLLAINIIVKSFSQNYFINFTASGASSNIDSIHILNFTQATSLSIAGVDVLHLMGVVDVSEHNKKNQNLSVYPNPFTEKTYIDFLNIKDGEISIQVLDMNGKKIFSFSKHLSHGVHVFELSGLKSGIYNLIIEGASGKYYTKIISAFSSKNIPQIKFLGTLKTDYPENILKNNKSTIPMQYNDGDILKLTGFSGTLTTQTSFIPIESQAINFIFAICEDGLGNNYSTITIGTQTWMSENLKYDNGCGNETLLGSTDVGWCGFYNNDAITYGQNGILYQWSAAMNGANSSNNNPSGVQGICPQGWHLPSKSEFEQLHNYLMNNGYHCGTNTAFVAKSIGSTTLWETFTGICTVGYDMSYNNSSGFNALPTGHWANYFDGFGYSASFWSATEMNSTSSETFNTNYSFNLIQINPYGKFNARSVRCVKN